MPPCKEDVEAVLYGWHCVEWWGYTGGHERPISGLIECSKGRQNYHFITNYHKHNIGECKNI